MKDIEKGRCYNPDPNHFAKSWYVPLPGENHFIFDNMGKNDAALVTREEYEELKKVHNGLLFEKNKEVK